MDPVSGSEWWFDCFGFFLNLNLPLSLGGGQIHFIPGGRHREQHSKKHDAMGFNHGVIVGF